MDTFYFGFKSLMCLLFLTLFLSSSLKYECALRVPERSNSPEPQRGRWVTQCLGQVPGRGGESRTYLQFRFIRKPTILAPSGMLASWQKAGESLPVPHTPLHMTLNSPLLQMNQHNKNKSSFSLIKQQSSLATTQLAL